MARRVVVDPASRAGAPPDVALQWTLARSRPASPGIVATPYLWRNLLDGPPPRSRRRGEGTYVLYHGMEHTLDVRIAYNTVVTVHAGADLDSTHDDVVRVEERLAVQRRALHELLDRERRFTERLTLRWRERHATRLAAHRRAAAAVRLAWFAAFLSRVVHVEARLGDSFISATRRLLRGLVVVPDKALTAVTGASLHLETRTGRRGVRYALFNPTLATSHEKGIAFLVALLGLVATVLFASNLFALALPGLATGYQRFMADFTASLLSVLALPIPQEILLVASTLAVGPVLGILGLLAGKIVGSWMLYLLGDTVSDALESKTATRPRLRRVTDAFRRNADRHGFWMLSIINAVPFVPDVLVYPFAVSGMRYRGYLGGILFGTLLKYVAIVAAIYVVGPDQVRAFLSDPFAAMRA